MDIREGQYDIWVLPMQGGAPMQVTNDAEEDRYPSWHPDGRRIIYSSKRGGAFRIMVVRLDDHSKTQITIEDSDYSVMDVNRDESFVFWLQGGSRHLEGER
jgi:Tol biopolymer transport system component